ncbi:MAG TPA: thioredoxin domain-containing protein [Myxococcota bacterium]|nr:thioredoxin domain-containing protein [Myxococcota bacterium]
MANGSNSGALVISALLLGSSIVAGSFLVRTAVDRTGAEVKALRSAIESVSKGGAEARDTGARAKADPSRRYVVDTKGAPVRGDPNAKVAVVEFSDFQCPYCGRSVRTLNQIAETYGDKVRIVFKHMPLGMHVNAPAAHAAAEAAHRQGKFWEMHNRIFANQAQMSPEKYREYAREIGLDLARYDRDLADASLKQRIDADVDEAEKLGVTGTPAWFVNGRFVPGAVPFETIKRMLDEDLGKATG